MRINFSILIDHPDQGEVVVHGNVDVPAFDIGSWDAHLSDVSNVAQAVADGFLRAAKRQPRRKASFDKGF